MAFSRFPHTPHLSWLGKGVPRDDKVLTLPEAEALLSRQMIVEEKVDGADAGFSISPDGDLQVQHRGQYLIPPYDGQFEKLNRWLRPRNDRFFDALGAELILFWRVVRRPSFHFCDRLPDLLLVFDVYDRKIKKFYNIERRNLLARQFDLHTVPLLFKGHTTLPILKELVTTRIQPVS
jgi:ATP-dependent RNA circularization protein (DNA/RNA ligase family)